jgi:molybdopterin-containing oxidoreductase family membrane subunit
MTTETTTRAELPQGVGKLSARWWLFLAILGVLTIVGIVAYTQEATTGMIVTGMRNVGTMGGATWALYITMVVYFIGVSFAGVTVAALIRIFNLNYLKPIVRIAELLTVVALVLGGLAIIADLGQPLRGIVNLFRYARPQSPFFGTFSLVVAGYLYASMVYLYLGGRRDAALLADYENNGLRWYHRLWAMGYKDTPAELERHRTTTFWLALAIIPLLVVAHSTLGFVFGLQVGRPGWYGTLQAPAFVALAGVSGVGLIIVFASIVRRSLGLQLQISMRIFRWLGTFLMVLLFVYLYFLIVELLTLLYATPEVEKRLSDALLFGEYALIYWGSVGALVISAVALAIMALRRSWSLGWIFAAGVLVNLAAIGKRFLIVVPSQTHGMLLPYEVGSYTPTWEEIAVIVGLFSLGALLLVGFLKTFPAVPLDAVDPRPEATNEEVADA